MGAILGALIGRHLAHVEDARRTTRDWILAPIIDRQKNPTSPNYTNEQLDDAVKAGYAHGYFDKHKKPIIDAQFKQMKATWQEARDKEVSGQSLARVQSNQPTDMGRPLTNPGTAPPVAAVGPQSQLPPPPAEGSPDAIRTAATGGAPPSSGSAPFGGPGGSAIMQRLLPLFMAAQQQPGGMQGTMQGAPPGATPPGPGPGTIQAQGTPPFANGTMAAGASGPMQQGENPKMAQAAVQGGEGFGTPPPAPTPRKPYYADTFGGGGMDPFEYAQREGRTKAMTALPAEEQSNRLALTQQAQMYRQTKAQQIAEQQRILDAITATDEFKKAPPQIQLEIRSRVLGMVGQITNPLRPTILPKSAMPNSEFPEGTLDQFGRELDRSPGKWSNALPDPSTGEVRAAATQPVTTKTKLLTDKGWVQVTQDPRGVVLNAMWDVDGSQITDPRMLETIRTTMQNRTMISVDQNGKPVSVVMQIPSESRSKVALPEQQPATGSPGAVPVAGQGTPIPIAGTGGTRTPAARTAASGGPAPAGQVAQAGTPKGAKVVAVLPRPLTAATQRTSEFAETVQKHIPVIYDLIDKLEHDPTGSKLGVIASRWNDFLAGKVGAGDDRFSQLRTNLSMFSSALAVAHQTRGVQIMKHFSDMANAGTLNAETLKANFGALKEWIDTYADMGKNRSGAIQTGAGGGQGSAMHNPPPKTPGGPDDLLKQLIDEYKNK